MTKKPHLYTTDRYERRPVRSGRPAIWNNLYYRRIGGRKPYKLNASTRWQLEYDLIKPWTAYCVHLPNMQDRARHIMYVAHQESFHTFADAVKWLDDRKHHDYEMEKIVNG